MPRPPKTQIKTRRRLAYCGRKMVLTTGSTLVLIRTQKPLECGECDCVHVSSHDWGVIQTNKRRANLSFNQAPRLLKIIEIMVSTLSKCNNKRGGVQTPARATRPLNIVCWSGWNVS